MDSHSQDLNCQTLGHWTNCSTNWITTSAHWDNSWQQHWKMNNKKQTNKKNHWKSRLGAKKKNNASYRELFQLHDGQKLMLMFHWQCTMAGNNQFLLPFTSTTHSHYILLGLCSYCNMLHGVKKKNSNVSFFPVSCSLTFMLAVIRDRHWHNHALMHPMPSSHQAHTPLLSQCKNAFKR